MLKPALSWPRACFPYIRGSGCAKTATGIARRRLNEQILERSFPKASAVGHHIECDAAGHAKIFTVSSVVQITNLGQQNIFEHHLRAACDIHVELGYLGAIDPWRRAQQFTETAGKHLV